MLKKIESVTRYVVFTILVLISFLCISEVNAQNGGPTFIYGDLRSDLDWIKNSRDYKISIMAGNLSGAPDNDFTTGWLGLDINFTEDTFFQVGLMTDEPHGLFWFVWAEEDIQVECLRGVSDWNGKGCRGVGSDLVELGYFHEVELVKYTQENHWNARVYNRYHQPTDVARFYRSEDSIERVTWAFDEGFNGEDPFFPAEFYFYHPKWHDHVSGFMEWPFSEDIIGKRNTLYPFPDDGSICPNHYGGCIDYDGDPRFWFAGSGGDVCHYFLFPATNKIYLPTIISQ